MANNNDHRDRERFEIDNDFEMNDNENTGNTHDVSVANDCSSNNIQIPELADSQGEVELASSNNNGNETTRDNTGENESINLVNDCISKTVEAGELRSCAEAVEPFNECEAGNRETRTLTSCQEDVDIANDERLRPNTGEHESGFLMNNIQSNNLPPRQFTSGPEAVEHLNDRAAVNREPRRLPYSKEEADLSIENEYGSEPTGENTYGLESVGMVSDGSCEHGAFGFDHESNESIVHDQSWENGAYGVLNCNRNRSRVSITEHGECSMENNQNTDNITPHSLFEMLATRIGADSDSNSLITDQRNEVIRSESDDIVQDVNRVNRTDGVNTFADNIFIGINSILSNGSKKSDDISSTYSEATGGHVNAPEVNSHTKFESASNSTVIPFSGEEQPIRNDRGIGTNTNNTNNLLTVQDIAGIISGAHLIEANNHFSESIDYDNNQQGGAIGFEKSFYKQRDTKLYENKFKKKSAKKKNKSQTNVNGHNNQSTLLKKLFSNYTITHNSKGDKKLKGQCTAIPDYNITTDNDVNTGGDGSDSSNTNGNNDGMDEDPVNQTDGGSNENGAYGGNNDQTPYPPSRSGPNADTPSSISTLNNTTIRRGTRDSTRYNDNYYHDTDDTIFSLNRPGTVDMHFRYELYPNDREATEPNPNLQMPRAGVSLPDVGDQVDLHFGNMLFPFDNEGAEPRPNFNMSEEGEILQDGNSEDDEGS